VSEAGDMFVGFPAMLNAEDDPHLWRSVLAVLLDEFSYRHPKIEKGTECFLQIGACSHWFRPHQSRWTAAGGLRGRLDTWVGTGSSTTACQSLIGR